MAAFQKAYLVASGYKPLAPAQDGEIAWVEGQGSLPLARGECHVWSVRLDQTPQCVRHVWAFLSDAERAKASQFYGLLDRQRFIVARGLLRILLGHYTGASPEEIQFFYSEYGKPKLDATDLHFNKSASASICLFAFSRDAEIGVDVEMRRDLEDIDRLEKELSEEERAEMMPVDRRADLFYRAWTRKEAVLKALGTGFALPPENLKMSLGESPRIEIPFDAMPGQRPLDWLLKSWEPASGYQAALAFCAGSSKISFYRLVAQELGI